MHENLKEFKELWKSITDTGAYKPKVEELAMQLRTTKELDIRTQEDLMYFNFAVIFADFLIVYNKSKK